MTLFSPPSAAQIEAQIRWEYDSVERGIRRFREHARNAALADLPAGQSAFRDVMPGLVAAIKETQEAVKKDIQSLKAVKPQAWSLLILCLDAERMAYLTIRTLLSSTVHENMSASEQAVTNKAAAIAEAVRTQMEFEDWKRSENAKAQAAKAAGEQPVNLYQALLRATKQVDTRAFKSWSRKINRIRAESWTVSQKVHLGTKLINLAVVSSNGWFEVKTRPLRGGKTQMMVSLTALAKAAVADIHHRAEVALPLHMPCICPPKPWRHEDTRQALAA